MFNIYALIATIFTFGFGIILILFVQKYLNHKGNVIILLSFILPPLIYLTFSGKIVEIKGAGIEARFQTVSNRNIQPINLKPIEESPTKIINESQKNSYFAIGAPVVILDVSEHTQESLIERVYNFAIKIYPGLIDGQFKVLVVVDQNNRVKGYFPRDYFLDILHIPVNYVYRSSVNETDFEGVRNNIRKELEQTLLWDIVEYPILRAEENSCKIYARKSDTNIQVLKIMAEEKIDTIIVIDNKGIYSGIINRNDIVNELLLSFDKN